MCPTPWSSNYWIFAHAWSYCVVSRGKQRYGEWRIFSFRMYKTGLLVRQQDYSVLAGMSDGFPESWKLLARCPAVSWLPVIKSTVFLLMLWDSFKFRGVPVPAPVWKCSVRIPQQVRPTEVTESQWKRSHNHENPQSRKHHQELLSQFVPLCTPFPSQRMLSPACHVKHP